MIDTVEINQAIMRCQECPPANMPIRDVLNRARASRMDLKKCWERAAAEVSCTVLGIEFVIAELEDRAREKKE